MSDSIEDLIDDAITLDEAFTQYREAGERLLRLSEECGIPRSQATQDILHVTEGFLS